MGHITSGGDEGNATHFYPTGLRFFTLRKSVPLVEGQLLRACVECGHVWTQVVPSELKGLLARSGSPETLQRVLQLEREQHERGVRRGNDGASPV